MASRPGNKGQSSTSLNSFLGDEGAALVSAIWFSLFVAVIATVLISSLGRENGNSLREQEFTALKAGEEAAIQNVIWELLADRRPDGPACRVGTSQQRSNIFGQDWIIRISPERSRVDLNLSAQGLVSAAFAEMGLSASQAATMAARITDYIDADDRPVAGGAEARHYAAMGLAVRPANRKLASLSEVQSVAGFDRQLFQIARPYITVFGSSRPDQTQADPVVRRAMLASMTLNRTAESTANEGDNAVSENPVDTADSHIPVCNHSGVYRVEAFREGETGGTVQIVRIGSPSSPAVAVLEEWRQPMRIASESDLEAD